MRMLHSRTGAIPLRMISVFHKPLKPECLFTHTHTPSLRLDALCPLGWLTDFERARLSFSRTYDAVVAYVQRDQCRTLLTGVWHNGGNNTGSPI